jgi:N-acetyl-anhydromuramyl-L-alanine amidase AmpD
MKKKLFINIVIAIAVLLMAIFGFMFLRQKKTVQIQIQSSSAESQQTTNNNQESENIDKKQETNDKQDITDTNSEIQDTKNKETMENKKSSLEITSRLVSWGFQKASGRKIDTIIIHSTYDAIGDDPYDVDGVIAEYKQYRVSPHYLIDRNGKIYRLVADQNIAYHAGVSKTPDGRTDVNNFSIGVEMINTTESKFTSDQYAAFNDLIISLKKQYSIKYILGHDDIAPGRKTDPWNINWNNVNR